MRLSVIFMVCCLFSFSNNDLDCENSSEILALSKDELTFNFNVKIKYSCEDLYDYRVLPVVRASIRRYFSKISKDAISGSTLNEHEINLNDILSEKSIKLKVVEIKW